MQTAERTRFTEAEMATVRDTDLPDLLISLGYQVKRIGRYYTTQEMDSIRIKDRRTWFRYSEGIGGDAIDVLVYRGEHIEWWKSTNVGFNPARFKSRLTKDFCINGFQFLYDITNSAQPDYNLYSYAPEFLQDLDYLLGTQLVNDFRAESQTFVALCRVPKAKIVFDYNADDGRFEERYIYSALSYIWEYCYSKNEQVRKGYNCMLRALDDYTVHIERWVLEEEIECQR